MGSSDHIKKCPECGAVLKPEKSSRRPTIIKSVAVGMVVGVGVGFWFVSWWFAGTGFTHTMALIHEISGGVLGALAGWGVGVYLSRR